VFVFVFVFVLALVHVPRATCTTARLPRDLGAALVDERRQSA
jgi:hypothetical protein